MADTVNPQITDAVTQTNTTAVNEAPELAMANLFQATAQALAMAAQNASKSQGQAATLMQAATTQAITTLLRIDAGAAKADE